MVTKRTSREPSLRTILDRIDVLGAKADSQGATLERHGRMLEDLGGRVDSQNQTLEDMRSQNRLTIEAVEAARLALDQRIERLEQDTRSRDAMLELAVRELRVGVQQNSIEIRDLAGKVESLARIEERVAAIERRLA